MYKSKEILKVKNSRVINSKIMQNAFAWLLLVPAVIVLYYIVWRPVGVGIMYSFYKMQGFTPVKFVGFSNYIKVVKDTMFLRTLANTFSYVLYSLALGFFLPIILAVLLNEVVHLQRFFKFSIFVPCVIPMVATSLIWSYIYYPSGSGLLNMLISVFGIQPQTWLQNSNYTIILIIITLTWHEFGNTCIMYLASLQGVSQELYEAAMIDGAGFFCRVIKITLPQISGIILLFFVQQIIGVFQIMEQPLVMTDGGPNGASMTLALQGYRYAFVYNNIGSSLAIGVITFLILIGLTAVYFVLNKKVEENY